MMRALAARSAALGARALDLLYPPICIACRAPVAEPGSVCVQCWRTIRFIERPYCERLGTPFSHDLGPGVLSPEAIADPPAYARSRAVALYDDGPVARMVHGLKYSDKTYVARPMGQWMARAGAELLAEADLLVPIPLHRRRLFSRRFNQAAMLAHEIARHASVSVNATALRRVKATTPQVGLTRAQRAANVQAAFRVEPDRLNEIAGQRIVLIDDVLTSGATTDAAARTLLRAKAARVEVLVFARVVTHG